MSQVTINSLYHDLYQQSIHDPETFWSHQAKTNLHWIHEFQQVKDCDFPNGMVSWFLGGRLNACENCVDRHVEKDAKTNKERYALIWEGDNPDPSEVRKITYRKLQQEVCRLANVLRHHNIRKGDRVAIYMGMVPEAVYAMLACARIGAVHTVVFAGFSAEALRDRINDAHCKAVITCDEGVRGGKIIPLKRIVDEAVMACPTIQNVFIAERTNNKIPFYPPRDVMLKPAMQQERPYAPIEHMDSEDPLFILYTSGSTGKPKGIVHTTAGYLLYSALTHKTIFDYKEGDIFACMADIGWITGHTYLVYGPLCNGGTSIIFESTPLYPNPGRYWDMVERHRITHFYTAPTALRSIAREGEEWVKKYDRSSLRVLGSVGEPIDPATWHWYHQTVGEGRCDIVDTWWQTETGAAMISPIHGVTTTIPGSATLPFYGIRPVILSEQGEEILGNNVSGLLAIKDAWPGLARTIQNDHERFVDTYFKAFPGYYLTGDGCRRDENGYYWITGRVDDVLNISGHRIGTAEIESALKTHPVCAEAAVVGVPHAIKGQAIFAYIVLKEQTHPSYTDTNDLSELLGELKNEVRHHIGPFASPDILLIVEALPKTRSGKVMRRILRKLANKEFEQLGDITTLADPCVVEAIKTQIMQSSQTFLY